jgi:hypothetical protein
MPGNASTSCCGEVRHPSDMRLNRSLTVVLARPLEDIEQSEYETSEPSDWMAGEDDVSFFIAGASLEVDGADDAFDWPFHDG